MQETHLKKCTKVDFLATFKSFEPGECEILPYSETQTHTTVLRSLYCKYRRMGLLTHKISFTELKNPAGTLVLRRE